MQHLYFVLIVYHTVILSHFAFYVTVFHSEKKGPTRRLLVMVEL